METKPVEDSGLVKCELVGEIPAIERCVAVGFPSSGENEDRDGPSPAERLVSYLKRRDL